MARETWAFYCRHIEQKKEQAMKTKNILSLLCALLIAACFTSCTHHAQTAAKTDAKLQERERELWDAAHKANEHGDQRLRTAVTVAGFMVATPAASNLVMQLQKELVKALTAYELSDDFILQGAAVSGAPTHPQDDTVNGLLSDNEQLRKQAVAANNARKTEVETEVSRRKKAEAKLLEMGAQLEAEKNRNIVSRVWHWAIGTLGIGGLIALCFFFPFLIPLVGKLIGFVVTKIPSLASAFGVVAVKSYDALVHGVELAKERYKTSKDETPVEAVFDGPMREAMAGQSDKTLVRQRKAALLAKKVIH